ncbi:hypothetical protein ARMGADRAFT_1027987 [Armillaria gallica]|uniref:Uncharacterized protein n=1 Tax=Armillaria gallica TaxID=47427 RepID=A0A2H3E979_ARMGA|nr:hypothetical protein ARMGADRAFT_1027987 [Armillaria gallica]
MTVLSCHDMHHEELNATSTGGYPDYFPTQLVPSQAPVLSSTLTPSQMQVQAPVLLLSLETGGVHGDSYQDGSPMNATSNGLKEWVSSFLSEQSQCKIQASKGTHSSENHVKLHGDNANLHVYTRYVTSASNPANGPSRGVYPQRSLLLPPILLPDELLPFIINYDVPITLSESKLGQSTVIPKQYNPELYSSDPQPEFNWLPSHYSDYF